MFSKEDVVQKSLEYFKGDELAADVITKYLLRDETGKYIEDSPEQMHRRLAREFARIEAKYPNPLTEDQIFSYLDGFKYIIPQGSPMSAIGNDKQLQSLSNCFVIDSPKDSYGGILYTDQEQVQLMKRRGGVGFDISNIRPAGATTTNAARTTDGIGVFMERFSNSCREVAQGGRRGALLISIDCAHNDIETFISIKRDLKKVTGANISIKFTDEFMKAVQNDTDFTLRWPTHCTPEEAKITKIVKAKDVWNKFIESAWQSAEPGALFWDTVTRTTPADIYKEDGYESISTNPCGELVLCSYDSCRLLAVNYSSFVDDAFTRSAKFNYEKFHNAVVIAQRLMDDLVDLELEAIERIMQKIDSDEQEQHIKQIEIDLWKKIKEKCQKGRRTGTGTTGLGDALAMIGIRYGSNESLDIVDNLYTAFSIAVHESSCVLAKERGAFPVFSYEKEKNHEYVSRVIHECGDDVVEMWKTTGRRNIACSTIAPTGSVSCLTRTTSGIEPAYLLSYKRRRKLLTEDTRTPDFVDDMGDRWQEYIVYHHGLKQWMDVTGKSNIEESPYWGATSNDVDWLNSVKLQAVAQRHIDHSISKTCNFPNSVSKELISKAYMEAWKSGCKGFTVYRDGSRDGVLVSTDDKQVQKKQSLTRNADKRPKEVTCDIHRVTIKGESWLVLVGVIDGKPYEIFSGLAGNIEVPKKIKQGLLVKNGKKEGITTYNLVVPLANDDQIVFKDVVNLFDNPTHGAFTRTLSLTLRHDIPINFIVEQLQKDKDMFAFSKCLARVLKTYIPDGVKSSSTKKCDECGSGTIIYKEGCASCSQCSWSKCA